ncbi:SDR family NAD(P)-dependent oxidoreductase [Paractinoplanes durhamensis]|uniref:Carrier domain-containing protein n=1 Tax=Paractinoplanes durhamensis TaxID=113563 RepID=A0ABQ3ZDL1_9ACTN|nr:SDR family NAD(P)-dependent oxidoreductase [Actinoplanes durhamensis]GIE07875.1 hypothetical protein Adu01nite_92250 [Actinoplanes durhamensis]
MTGFTDETAELDRLVALAGTVPGIADAAAVVRYAPARVLPEAPPEPAATRAAPAVPEAESFDGPPAVADGGPLSLPADWPATLPAALARAAERHPGHGTTYIGADGSTRRQTYPALLDGAERVLRGLRRLGLRPGESVLLQCDDNQNFVTAYWGCLLGGFLPTPVGVAPTYTVDNAVVRKLRSAWHLLDRPPIVTDAALLDVVGAVRELWDGDVVVAAVEELADGPRDPDWYPAEPDDIALNLLTSGSTGVPKCVQHPHRTIAARTWATAVANGFDEHEVSLNWMPLDHVGGIVMYQVRDVFLGCDQVNARADAFVADPLRWLDWADRHRATNTWAPNFAFALVNAQEARLGRGSWQLSALRNICNAGEAVVARTAQRFVRLLAPHGLPADAMVATWGMSETSSGVTGGRLFGADEAAGTVTVQQSSLAGALVYDVPGAPDTVTLTEVGAPIPGVTLRVVDGTGRVLPESRVGRLQIRGATMLRHYYGNAEANRESFVADGWFNTGDLAFIRAGRATLTGREKDLIVVRGANYLCHEIESTVSQVPGVAVTYVAACGVPDEDEGTDRLAVFFVPAVPGDDDGTVCAAIRATLAADLGLPPDIVVPVSEAEFPKTESGKIQRTELVARLRSGDFDERLQSLAVPADPDPWCFVPVWQAEPATVAAAGPGGVLWFAPADADPAGLAAASVHTVRPGAGFARVGSRHHEIDPAAPDDYRRLVEELRADGVALSAVVFAWPLTEQPDPATPAEFRAAVNGTLAALLWLTQALAGEPVDLLVVTRGGHQVSGGDRFDARAAGVAGFVRSAAEESVLRSVRQLDVAGNAESVVAAIRRELRAAGDEPIVADRGGRRLVPRLRPAPDLDDSPAGPGALRPGGHYLLTGGLGGIGFELAQYLLATYRCRLLVLGRTVNVAPGQGVAGLRLAELRELGDVRYANADVTDPDAIDAAVIAAERDWGPVDGVLHLAGASVLPQWSEPESHTLLREAAGWFEQMTDAKVCGAWSLDRWLAARPDTPLVLFSSVNGYFGGSTFAAYSAANSALFSLAGHRAAGGLPTRCLAWSMWRDTGMNTGSPFADAATHRGFRMIEPGYGIAAFVSALSAEHSTILIGLNGSNEHIQAALATDHLDIVGTLLAVTAVDSTVSGTDLAEAVRARLARADPDAAARCTVAVLSEIPRDAAGRPAAPQLRSAARLVAGGGYQEPQGDLEHRLAGIWGQVLAAPRVGRDDSFFHLGGSSLRAMRLLARINETLGTDYPVRMLYENPTLRQFAGAVAVQV